MIKGTIDSFERLDTPSPLLDLDKMEKKPVRDCRICI
jgi:hypothetical protein